MIELDDNELQVLVYMLKKSEGVGYMDTALFEADQRLRAEVREAQVRQVIRRHPVLRKLSPDDARGVAEEIVDGSK